MALLFFLHSFYFSILVAASLHPFKGSFLDEERMK